MSNTTVMLPNVVIAYPKFGAKKDRYGKTSCNALFSEKSKAAKLAQAAVDKVIEEEGWEGQYIKPDKMCLRPGEERVNESTGVPLAGFAGKMALSISTKDEMPPRVFMGRGGAGDEKDPASFKGGNVCNVLVQFWGWKHEGTKMVNCQLMAIQWLEPGEPMQAGGEGVDESILADTFKELPPLDMDDGEADASSIL